MFLEDMNLLLQILSFRYICSRQCSQVFVGRDSLVADAYPLKSGKQFVNTLEDFIRRRADMDKLLSDSAKTEISKKVMDILEHITSPIGILSHITKIRVLLNGGIEQLSPGPIQL